MCARGVQRSIADTLQDLIKETEKLLENWKHPDPYRPPTAPGGEMANPGIRRPRPRLTYRDRLQVRAQPACAHLRP